MFSISSVAVIETQNMAASHHKRLSRGRKFLYQNEVEKFLSEDDNSARKKILTALPIAEDTKAKLCKKGNLCEVLKKLDEFGSGVCRISVAVPNLKHLHAGTGFYVGDGWVITTAHVLRNRDQVCNASFTFTSPQGSAAIFTAQDRRALVYRMLPPGRRPDYRNRDFTLIKLGVQYQGLRKKQENTAWEKNEQDLLARHKPYDFKNLINIGSQQTSAALIQPREGDEVCAVFHGKDPDVKRFQVGLGVTEAYRVLDTRLLQFSGGFDATVSGGPVLLQRGDEWFLLGVLFAGTYYNAGGGSYVYAGEGLVWNEEIMANITAGMKAIDKMGNIETYSVEATFDERAKLLTKKSVYKAAELAVDNRILIL